ncbi:MAG: UDP-N-acetylmuramate dehydrogenase [Trueperella sp.]|nr:UDP-N-acetylmuramate dehydrogenase [Trueperella sp.]
MTCLMPEPTEPTKTVPPVQSARVTADATRLAELTTIGVGGAPQQIIRAESEAELIAAIRSADDAGLPLLVLGGGSNILAADADFPGVVIRDERQEITTLDVSGCGGAELRATAGTPWDEVVVYAIENGWMGVEALSGIPGSVGAAPVQNIGAYGQELAETFAMARVYDRERQRTDSLFLSDMKFGYRDSILKRSMRAELPDAGDATPKQWTPSPRWIVLDVTLQMRLATLSRPVRYAQLAAKLDIEPGERAPSAEVRAAVLELRRSKGMVLDDADADTFSLGSFFTNPVLTEAAAANLPPEAPRFAVTDGAAVNQIGAAAPKVAGQVKTSAAWLISNAGFAAGYGMPGPAALSTKHSLAITNRGTATAADIAQLARTVRDGVLEKFGVRLVPEPVLVGLEI